MPVSTLSRPRLLSEVDIGLQFLSQSRTKRNILISLFSIDFRRIIGFQGVWGPDSCFPHRDTLEKRDTRKLDFHWFPVDQWIFRGVLASDSCFPRRDTPGKRVSRKLDFHWILVNQWGCEANRPHIRVPHIELPLTASKVITVCRLAGNVLLTRLQTNTQTIIYFVRPSSQSREHPFECLEVRHR
jgi:hypothetical protein